MQSIRRWSTGLQVRCFQNNRDIVFNYWLLVYWTVIPERPLPFTNEEPDPTGWSVTWPVAVAVATSSFSSWYLYFSPKFILVDLLLKLKNIFWYCGYYILKSYWLVCIFISININQLSSKIELYRLQNKKYVHTYILYRR